MFIAINENFHQCNAVVHPCVFNWIHLAFVIYRNELQHHASNTTCPELIYAARLRNVSPWPIPWLYGTLKSARTHKPMAYHEYTLSNSDSLTEFAWQLIVNHWVPLKLLQGSAADLYLSKLIWVLENEKTGSCLHHWNSFCLFVCFFKKLKSSAQVWLASPDWNMCALLNLNILLCIKFDNPLLFTLAFKV